MTARIQFCIFIPSFSIWLALSNQVASAKKINYLLGAKNETCQQDTNEDKKYNLTCKNTFRENLRAKFKHYRHHNDWSNPKTESIKWFDNNHKNSDEKEQIGSSVNYLNISLINKKAYDLTRSSYIASNNLIQIIKKRRLEEKLIQRKLCAV